MTGIMPIAGLNDILNDARTACARSWHFRENILFSTVFELGSSNLTCRQYTSSSFIIYTYISCGGHSSRSKVTRVSKFQRRVATLIFTLLSPNKNQIVRFLIFFPTVTSFLLYDFRFLRYKHLRQLFQTRADSLILIISSQIGNQFVRFLILFPAIPSFMSCDFRFLRYTHLRP